MKKVVSLALTASMFASPVYANPLADQAARFQGTVDAVVSTSNALRDSLKTLVQLEENRVIQFFDSNDQVTNLSGVLQAAKNKVEDGLNSRVTIGSGDIRIDLSALHDAKTKAVKISASVRHAVQGAVSEAREIVVGEGQTVEAFRAAYEQFTAQLNADVQKVLAAGSQIADSLAGKARNKISQVEQLIANGSMTAEEAHIRVSAFTSCEIVSIGVSAIFVPLVLGFPIIAGLVNAKAMAEGVFEPQSEESMKAPMALRLAAAPLPMAAAFAQGALNGAIIWPLFAAFALPIPITSVKSAIVVCPSLLKPGKSLIDPKRETLDDAKEMASNMSPKKAAASMLDFVTGFFKK